MSTKARKAKPAKDRIELETRAVGLQFRLKPSARAMLARRAPFPVKLYREPENEEDENAIRIHVGERHDVEAWAGMHIAYLPRAVAAEIAPLLDSGKVTVFYAMLGKFHSHDTEAPLFIQFKRRISPANRALDKRKKAR